MLLDARVGSVVTAYRVVGFLAAILEKCRLGSIDSKGQGWLVFPRTGTFAGAVSGHSDISENVPFTPNKTFSPAVDLQY